MQQTRMKTSVVAVKFIHRLPCFLCVLLFPKRDGGMEITAITFSSIGYI